MKTLTVQAIGQVTGQQQLVKDIYYLTIAVPEIACLAKPGQFVQVKCSESYTPLLRKPFSLHQIDQKAGTISLLYEVKGRGTKLLSEFQVGDSIDLLGPLGKGFILPKMGGRALLVGGGMGIAPLLPLAGEFKEQKQEFIVILGFNDASRVCRQEAFSELGGHVIITTVDGSLGEKGLVTKPLAKELETGNYDFVYACGPEVMLKKVVELAERYSVECQISLEAYMACGFGACLGCTCTTKTQNGSTYSRVCTEGPVFNGKEVIWHEG